VAETHRFRFSSFGDDAALFIVFLFVNLAVREPLVENAERARLAD
jgi:hypothetical protein